jgi:hypothetical protein
VRILISLMVVMPAGFLMGFAFPTGMLLVENVDREPTPWFGASTEPQVCSPPY